MIVLPRAERIASRVTEERAANGRAATSAAPRAQAIPNRVDHGDA
jgi:hypothetical protein